MKIGSIGRLAILGFVCSFGRQTVLGQNLIANPGFETGDFSGWMLSGNTGFEGVSTSFASTPNSGNYSAFFGAVGSFNIISQTIATTPGDTYNFSFALDNSGGPYCEAFVDWNAVQAWDIQPTDTFGWTVFGWNQVATTTSTTISFGFQQVPSYFNLDDVSLVDLTLPPPVVTTTGGSSTSTPPPDAPPYVPVLNTSTLAPPIPDPPKIPDQGVGLWMFGTTMLGLGTIARRRRSGQAASR